MTRKKIKFSHTKWLLPLWVLLIGSIALYMIAHAVQQADSRHLRTLAELNAVTYGDSMIADLNAGINITDTLEQILISTDGRIDKFDIIADRMMADYVRSIQVAPGGIVTDIYPAEGNEAGKIDLIHDKYRGETVNYSIANDVLIIHGPFELEQGGHVLSIRNPVFLQDEKGTPYFWGMTMVIIKVPDIFQHSANALTNFGYQYRLSKTISPLTDEYTVVDQSEETLMDPVSYDFTLGGCNWRLEIMPTGGWKNGTLLQLIVLCGIAVILLLVVLTISILFVDEQRKKFRRLSLTDSMTGLLNRNGFNLQLEKYLESSGTSMEDLRAHAREQAAGAARFELAMTEIARLEGIDVTDDDVEQKYAELSAQYQLSRDLLRQQLPPLRLRHDLKLARAQAVVVDSARRK